MNRCRFPVRKCLDAIDVAADGRPRSDQGQRSRSKSGVNDHDIVAMARTSRDADHILRFIEYMDVGIERLRMDDVIQSAESDPAHPREYP